MQLAAKHSVLTRKFFPYSSLCMPQQLISVNSGFKNFESTVDFPPTWVKSMRKFSKIIEVKLSKQRLTGTLNWHCSCSGFSWETNTARRISLIFSYRSWLTTAFTTRTIQNDNTDDWNRIINQRFLIPGWNACIYIYTIQLSQFLLPVYNNYFHNVCKI